MSRKISNRHPLFAGLPDIPGGYPAGCRDFRSGNPPFYQLHAQQASPVFGNSSFGKPEIRRQNDPPAGCIHA